MAVLDDIQQGFANLGLNQLGIASPLLAVRWTEDATPTEGAAESLSLTSTDGWVAPAGGVLSFTRVAAEALLAPTQFVAPAGVLTRILRPDGSSIPETELAAILRLHPQIYLRLTRLYASILESRNDDLPRRPVPHFFVYTGIAAAAGATVEAGIFRVNDPLGITGTLTIHDLHGLAIDPVGVASHFRALLLEAPVLQPRATLATSPVGINTTQIHAINELGATGLVLHLVDPHGKPVDGTGLAGIESVSTAGLTRLSSGSTAVSRSGTDSDVRVGPATNGTLGTSFTPPTPPAAVSLRRDFLRLVAVDLKPFLIGQRPSTDPAADRESLPEIRHNEAVTFSLDGNALLGEANRILSGGPTESLVVAPALQGDFAVPADGSAANAQWPNFPPGLPAANDPVPASLRNNFNPTARFIAGTQADVALTLNGLTPGQAVRVYNRVFLPDAREGRGNGAGGTVPAGGTVELVLKDPLGLVRRGESVTLPAEPTLHVDVAVVNSLNQVRVFGNVTAAIEPPGAAPALPAEDNPFDNAADQGVAPAGILGLATPALPPGPFDNLEAIKNLALALGGEGTPRSAPRLPTMARRDALVGAKQGVTWRGQVSGAHLVPATRNAQQRRGSPGSPGGPEVQAVAAQTQGGRLAYDLSRAALRRTRHLATRLVELAGADWDLPAAAASDTLSGAVLQTVAPFSETPELGPFPSLLTSLPETWADTVDAVVGSATVPSALSGAMTSLRNSDRGERLHAEFGREFSASIHGRRDALWALERALGAARELVYLEGPAFTPTDYGDDPQHDLVKILRERMEAAPGLKVVLALSKELDYGPGYEPFAAREFARRLKAVNDLAGTLLFVVAETGIPAALDDATVPPELQTAFQTFDRALSTNVSVDTVSEGKAWVLADFFQGRRFSVLHEDDEIKVFLLNGRVVTFHPVGFPGRPLRLQTNIFVVDDVWAMVGSSTVRRRGLTFDGGVDLVLFDRELREGRGRRIADFRRRLMAGHLGAPEPAAGAVPHPNWVRLADAHTAFEAAQELLVQGGAGLIEPLFDGRVPGAPVIPESAFPNDAVADPEGREFNTAVALLVAALASFGTPALPP